MYIINCIVIFHYSTHFPGKKTPHCRDSPKNEFGTIDILHMYILCRVCRVSSVRVWYSKYPCYYVRSIDNAIVCSMQRSEYSVLAYFSLRSVCGKKECRNSAFFTTAEPLGKTSRAVANGNQIGGSHCVLPLTFRLVTSHNTYYCVLYGVYRYDVWSTPYNL